MSRLAPLAPNEVPISKAWVIVAGGFHQRGGMDKANAALASYLAARGNAVHLVAHEVDPNISEMQQVHVHLVPRPLNSVLLGAPALSRRGHEVEAELRAAGIHARCIVNGGNCPLPGVNWVHSVHAEWPCVDAGAPLWFRMKNRLFKLLSRRDERRAIMAAQCVVANSESTRQALRRHFPLDPTRIRVVYLGTDAAAPEPPERTSHADANASMRSSPRQRTVLFVGALSHDNNKGLDTLWRAWTILARDPAWDARLLVAGGGNASDVWKRRARAVPWSANVSILGFQTDINGLLRDADLLVSPVRYEAYGLNVQEALMHGVPVIASARSGIAERFPPECDGMILKDVESDEELVVRMRAWRADEAKWRRQAMSVAQILSEQTWNSMAQQITSFAESACTP